MKVEINNIELCWNGSTVLIGKASCSMAYDTLQAFFNDNFVGPDHKKFMREEFPSYDAFTKHFNLHYGVILTYSDKTGEISSRYWK